MEPSDSALLERLKQGATLYANLARNSHDLALQWEPVWPQKAEEYRGAHSAQESIARILGTAASEMSVSSSGDLDRSYQVISTLMGALGRTYSNSPDSRASFNAGMMRSFLEAVEWVSHLRALPGLRPESDAGNP